LCYAASMTFFVYNRGPATAKAKTRLSIFARTLTKSLLQRVQWQCGPTVLLAYPQKESQSHYEADRSNNSAREHDRHLVSVIATLLRGVRRSVRRIVLAEMSLLRTSRNV